MRIVLLARGSGEWWQRLATSLKNGLPGCWTSRRSRSGRYPSPGGQAELFAEALTAFAGKLGVARPAARLMLWGPEPVVLVVHAAALLAVLDHAAGGGGQARSAAEVLDGLLDHESAVLGADSCRPAA